MHRARLTAIDFARGERKEGENHRHHTTPCRFRPR